MDLLESLGMSLRAEKTQAAWLGGGEPPVSRLDLPGRGLELPVAGEINFLGIHFLGPERFRARETTVNRLLRNIRTTIVAGRGKRPARQRCFQTCRRINELFGYELTGRPTRCRIGRVRYVQPRQHAVLSHSELILEQMRRVDRTVRNWLRREFGPMLTGRAIGRARSRGVGAWRVRSAMNMYEMEAQPIFLPTPPRLKLLRGSRLLQGSVGQDGPEAQLCGRREGPEDARGEVRVSS